VLHPETLEAYRKMTDLTAALYDIVDADVNVLIAQKLNEPHWRSWADELGVGSQLDNALAESNSS